MLRRWHWTTRKVCGTCPPCSVSRAESGAGWGGGVVCPCRICCAHVHLHFAFPLLSCSTLAIVAFIVVSALCPVASATSVSYAPLLNYFACGAHVDSAQFCLWRTASFVSPVDIEWRALGPAPHVLAAPFCCVCALAAAWPAKCAWMQKAGCQRRGCPCCSPRQPWRLQRPLLVRHQQAWRCPSALCLAHTHAHARAQHALATCISNLATAPCTHQWWHIVYTQVRTQKTHTSSPLLYAFFELCAPNLCLCSLSPPPPPHSNPVRCQRLGCHQPRVGGCKWSKCKCRGRYRARQGEGYRCVEHGQPERPKGLFHTSHRHGHGLHFCEPGVVGCIYEVVALLPRKIGGCLGGGGGGVGAVLRESFNPRMLIHPSSRTAIASLYPPLLYYRPRRQGLCAVAGVATAQPWCRWTRRRRR